MATQTGQQSKRPFQQGFGIGAGVEYTGIYRQPQAEKFAPAAQISHRLTLQPALYQLLPAVLLGVGQHFIIMRQEPAAASLILPQGVQQQKLGIQRCQALRNALLQGLCHGVEGSG